MDFEAYRSGGRDRYAAFVEALRSVLRAAVAARGFEPHAITGRAKAPGSLAKKLAARGIDEASAIDEQLKDLAGVRIVFLTGDQVDAFDRARILHDNFEVLDVNVHYAVPGTETETRLFDSTNYLVRLKPDRLALPEYVTFEGLRAEIQVQTLLNHAWAEMGHGTIYKQPQLKHLGQRQMNAIRERMDRVMRDHLLPAGHDFDKIAREFNELISADRSVDAVVETLAGFTDTENLCEAVGRLDNSTLPRFDQPCVEFLRIQTLLLEAVERTRGVPSLPVKASFGTYPGRGGEDVALQVSRLIRDYRYCDPTRTFAALIRLYTGADTKTEREVWVDLAKEFSTHELSVLQSHGPMVPQAILDGVEGLTHAEVTAAREPILAMLANVLSSEVAGATATSTTLTIHRTTVTAAAPVVALRARAITILERLIDEAADDVGRRPVIDALRKAEMTPLGGGPDVPLAMIMDDAARVLDIVRTRESRWGLELRRNCEVDALRCRHRFWDLHPASAGGEAEAVSRDRLRAEIDALRGSLAADPEFVLYSTLVGQDSVRPEAWDGDAFNHAATRAWREATFPKIVDQISDDDAGDWIARCAAMCWRSTRGLTMSDRWPNSSGY